MLSAYFRGTRSFVRHDGEHLNQEVNRAAETWQASIVLEGVQAPWEENRPATSCAEICWGLSGSRFRTLLDHLLSCPNEILNHIVDGSIETVFTLIWKIVLNFNGAKNRIATLSCRRATGTLIPDQPRR